ncbi:MAG: hypothetical protein WKG52_01475 [Variovorax sp.]
MKQAAAYLADSNAAYSRIAFGSLLDLARVQTGVASAEICAACNTINMGSTPFCKGCSHKLPAWYATMGASEARSEAKQPGVLPASAWALDLAAFWLVVNSLAVVTALTPIA